MVKGFAALLLLTERVPPNFRGAFVVEASLFIGGMLLPGEWLHLTFQGGPRPPTMALELRQDDFDLLCAIMADSVDDTRLTTIAQGPRKSEYLGGRIGHTVTLTNCSLSRESLQHLESSILVPVTVVHPDEDIVGVRAL